MFTTEVQVRFSETDLAGWVYYGNYFVYFEDGRSYMYDHLGFNYNDLRKEGIFLPIVVAHCEYKKPATYYDILEVHITILELGKTSLKTGYKIVNKKTQTIHVTGYCVQACVGEDGVSREFPEKLRKALVAAMETNKGKED
jgi:acyl-CoA thioester hydrolase